MHTRSPLLSVLPRGGTAHRVLSFSRRILLVLAFAGLAALLVFLVGGRRLPVAGPAYLLYWLHDRLFLTIKGYFYTLNFPWSLVWWGIATAFFAAWLASVIGNFLVERSLLRYLYLRWAKFLVYRPQLHRFIVAPSRWLRLEPRLLLAYVERERERVLRTLSSQESVSPADHGTLGSLTKLWSDLYLATHRTAVDQLTVCVRLAEALAMARVYSDTLTALNLVSHIARITVPVITDNVEGQSLSLVIEDGLFLPQSLALGLLCMALRGENGNAKLLPDAEPLRSMVAQASSTGWLAGSTDARRGQLEEISMTLESLVRQERVRTEQATVLLELLRKNGLVAMGDRAALVGELGLWVAILAAVEFRMPFSALAYVEAVDMVGWILECLPDNWSGPSSDLAAGISNCLSQLSTLTRGLPRPFHFELCARLAREAKRQEQRLWTESFDQDIASLGREAGWLSELRLDLLEQAVGPGEASEDAQ